MTPRPQLGNSPDTAKLVPGIVSTAGTLATGVLAIAGATAAIPIVGPIVAGVTLGLALLFGGGKSGALKVEATHIVDDLENNPKYGLKTNLAGYQQGPHTRASQTLALQNFIQVWGYVVSTDACGAAHLEDAGRNCIKDRDRGGKFDWWAAYYDPIANDPNVIDNPASDAIVAALPGLLSQADVSLIEKYWLPAVVVVAMAILL